MGSWVLGSKDSTRALLGAVLVFGTALLAGCESGRGGGAGECSTTRCENGGECRLESGEEVCACPAPYTGPTCESLSGRCEDEPCQNGGECVDDGDSLHCECEPPYSGPTCESVVGSCADELCENGATCVDVDDSFRCECAEGFAGTLCDQAAGCVPNPCENGGICSGTGEDVACVCAFGFAGATCGEVEEPGLEVRPSNTTCIAPPRPTFSGPVEWENARGGIDGLMMMRQLPDGSWLEILRSGQVYLVNPTGTRGGSPIFTVPNVATTGELGLLGLAVHPAFPASPYVYFYYATVESGDVHIRIDRFTTTGTGASLGIDGGSRTELLDFDRGEPWTNHAGGTLEFDPTSDPPLLYAAMGDGEQRAQVQLTNNYYGKLLRFRVDSLPSDPEIVGVGLRNPFRFSFDSLTGDLWIGDVGDSRWEEVTFVPAADIPATNQTTLNFGWPILEGFECLTGSNPATYCGQPTPSVLPLVAPRHVHRTGVVGSSIIGGRVYRGSDISGMAGTYVFGDVFPSGSERVWRLLPNPAPDPGDPSTQFVADPIPATNNASYLAFVEGNDGELYGVNGWTIHRLVAGDGGSEPEETLPAQLADTGCFGDDGEPGSGLIPYDLNAPLWSDGSTKKRWIALPNGESVNVEENGDFDFPAGTVLAKEFSVEGVRVETRLFLRHPDGVWAGYSYAWIDADGEPVADARLLPDEVITRPVPGTDRSWTYPSRGQCTQCHTRAAGGSLGLEVGQLNRSFSYPDGGTANQLHTLASIGVLDGDLESFVGRAFPRYDDETKPIGARAWSYLHANCSSCHQPGAPGFGGRSSVPDLRYDLFAARSDGGPLAERLCGQVAGAGDLGLGEGALLVEPGAPGNWVELDEAGSVLYLRMSARPGVEGAQGAAAMPPIGSALVDEDEGLPLVRAWIEQLACP